MFERIKGSFWLAAFIGFAVLVVDFFTKSWVRQAFFLEPKQFPIILWHNFLGVSAQITYTVNSGAAWGMFADFPGLLVIFRIILLVALIFYLFSARCAPSWRVPLVCIISGAMANVLDYFIYGVVIDMIQVNLWGYDYPVFNVADSSICIGALWLLTLAFFETDDDSYKTN